MESSAKLTNTLTSSEDEDKQDCMPKILNTISLQGCSTGLSFDNDQDQEEDDVSSLLYPTCEIQEEEGSSSIAAPAINTSSVPGRSLANRERERKRVKLTTLSVLKPPKTSKPRPCTSRDDQYHVVDARKLALQESLFKTKELFGTFLRVCQCQENTEEMERVVSKLSRAYDNTRPSFLGSMGFQNILEAETDKVNSANTKPWLNLKFVLDEMKSNKINNGPKLKLGDSEDSQDGGAGDDDEPVIECPKKRRHLKKLEKTLRQLNLKIKKLEEREVDFDDDNSAYVKLDRYRSQFTKVYTKVCEIKGKLADADRPYLRKVSFAGTTHPHINRCIERYYNKHREFPDFQDIKKLVTIANKQENIEMQPIKVHSMAEAAFKEFGEMLKRLRQYDDYDVIISYLDQQADPARDDQKLQEELTKNALLFKKREQEVLDRFAAEDPSMYSLSGHDSEIKPKKKRKIIFTSPRQKLTLLPSKLLEGETKLRLSSSESSDDEKNSKRKENSKPFPSLSSDSEDEKNVRVKKASKPASSLSSSSEDDSEDDSERIKSRVVPEKSPVKGKGKAILGKQRIVKRGVKPKGIVPKSFISSDEEEIPVKNPKDTLTSYLGLQITPKKEICNVVKDISDNDEKITHNKKKERPVENKNTKSVKRKNRSDSESSSHSLVIPIMDEIVFKSDDERPKKDNVLKNGNADEDSSGSDSIDIVEEVVQPKIKPKTEKPNTVLSKRKLNLSRSKQSLKSESDSDSDGRRTSVGKRKAVSESETELSTQDLSSDSSDTDMEDKKQDSGTIILSEETKPITNGSDPKEKSAGSSDSDICILSQEPKAKRATSINRKTSVRKDSSSGVNLLPTHNSRPLIAPRKVLPAASPASSPPQTHRRRLGNASSTPKPVSKRRLSNQSNGVNSKRSRTSGVSSSRANGSGTDRSRQSTLPQMMNGAVRKVSRPPPDDIPLIELD